MEQQLEYNQGASTGFSGMNGMKKPEGGKTNLEELARLPNK